MYLLGFITVPIFDIIFKVLRQTNQQTTAKIWPAWTRKQVEKVAHLLCSCVVCLNF